MQMNDNMFPPPAQFPPQDQHGQQQGMMPPQLGDQGQIGPDEGVCSIHNKKRKAAYLVRAPDGSLQCRAPNVCKPSMGRSGPELPQSTLQTLNMFGMQPNQQVLCGIHHKLRSVRNMQFTGIWVCLPTNQCQMEAPGKERRPPRPQQGQPGAPQVQSPQYQATTPMMFQPQFAMAPQDLQTQLAAQQLYHQQMVPTSAQPMMHMPSLQQGNNQQSAYQGVLNQLPQGVSQQLAFPTQQQQQHQQHQQQQQQQMGPDGQQQQSGMGGMDGQQ
jgi:hypothetical protein